VGNGRTRTSTAVERIGSPRTQARGALRAQTLGVRGNLPARAAASSRGSTPAVIEVTKTPARPADHPPSSRSNPGRPGGRRLVSDPERTVPDRADWLRCRRGDRRPARASRRGWLLHRPRARSVPKPGAARARRGFAAGSIRAFRERQGSRAHRPDRRAGAPPSPPGYERLLHQRRLERAPGARDRAALGRGAGSEPEPLSSRPQHPLAQRGSLR
jgi:hypothetical protein